LKDPSLVVFWDRRKASPYIKGWERVASSRDGRHGVDGAGG